MLGFQDVSIGTSNKWLLLGSPGEPSERLHATFAISPLLTPSRMHACLTGMCRYVKQGSLTAVLGPSASGKSLLLKGLSGRLPHLRQHGQVSVHGKIIDPSKPQGLGFAPQQDLPIGDLTVRSTECLAQASVSSQATPATSEICRASLLHVLL
jgi:ABC-type multidrug transport system ATPase subunit